MNSNFPKTTPLGDLTEIRSGGTPSKQKAEYWGGNIPWVSAKDMKTAFLADAEDHITQLGSQNGTKVAAAGDLLVLVRGMTLHNDVPICVLSRPMAFNQDVKSLSPVGIDRAFLFYALMAKKPELLRRVESAGHGTGRLGAELLKSLPIPRFDPTEEMEIAAILRALDDKIELNRRTAATLKEMARALYRSWFVDFDPVWAKTEGQTPAHMDEATAALFPNSFGDDGLPVGWRMVSLSSIATFLNGTALQKYPADADEDSLPVIKIAELRNGISARTGRASLQIPEKYRINDGDVLFSWSGSLMQKVWTEGNGALNQHLFKVYSSSVPKWFHYFAVDQHMEEFRRIAESKATTMGHIQRHHLDDALISLPPEEALHAADDIIRPLFEKRVTYDLENQTLATLRDTLLPKLMSGDLRVNQAQEFIEDFA